MNLDIVKLRWVFLVLYILIIAGLFVAGLQDGDVISMVVILLVTLATQAIFLFCSGSFHLHKPIRKRRAFIPVLFTAALMTILVTGTWLGIGEFIYGASFDEPEGALLWIFIALNWIGWSAAFLMTYTRHDRYTFIKRQVLFLLTGSLLQVMVMIPAHIITSRRSYCLAGLLTMAGVAGGLAVMLWSFGPGIGLLFLKHKQKA